MSVGSRIQKLLDSKGFTPAELSRRSGVGQGRLSLILSGKTPNPRGDTISKLAQALGVSVSSLLSDEKQDMIYAQDPLLEKSVGEYAAGWECKGEEFSEFEKRLIGMLRRLSPETRQEHFDAVTTSYFLQMEREFQAKTNKS